MKHLSFDNLLSGPIAAGATSPNPGGQTIIWSTITAGLLLWNGSQWTSIITDPELKSIEDLTTWGFLVRDQPTGKVVTRQIIGSAGQIDVTPSDGQGGNAVVSLVPSGISPGTYTKVEVDQYGRAIVGGSLSATDMPSDYIRLYEENWSNAAPNTVTGANAVAIGNGNAALQDGSIVLGEQGLARHKNALIHSSGRFGSQGDSQVGRYLLRTVTTNNFTKTLTLDGPVGTTELLVPDNSTWTFKATITAHRTDMSDGHAGFEIRGVIYRSTGANTVSFQGTPVVDIFSRSNASWTINTIANNVNGSLTFQVQGESGKTIRWLAQVETVEITN